MTVQEAKTIFEELLTVPKEMLIKYDSVTDDVQKKKLNDIYLAEQIAIECMQEVEQYRALGTIDGFKKALDGCVEYYNQMKEYKVKLSEYEALGTVEELKEAMEKQPKADWIPCKVELPPQPKENPLFENKPIELYLVSLGYADYPIRAFWNGKIFTDGWSKLNVTAWQPLPQPYKKEGAE